MGKVVQIMRDDMARTFRVDIETDSMVASTIESDMQALGEVLAGLTQFWQGVAPMIGQEFCRSMPSKAISLSIARRARMGMEVEDALDNMQAPPPPQPDPLEQAKLEVEKEKLGTERMKVQAEQQSMQMDGELKLRNIGSAWRKCR